MGPLQTPPPVHKPALFQALETVGGGAAVASVAVGADRAVMAIKALNDALNYGCDMRILGEKDIYCADKTSTFSSGIHVFIVCMVAMVVFGTLCAIGHVYRKSPSLGAAPAPNPQQVYTAIV